MAILVSKDPRLMIPRESGGVLGLERWNGPNGWLYRLNFITSGFGKIYENKKKVSDQSKA